MMQMGWSVEGQARVQRHASAHVPELSALLAEHHAAAHPAILQRVWPPNLPGCPCIRFCTMRAAWCLVPGVGSCAGAEMQWMCFTGRQDDRITPYHAGAPGLHFRADIRALASCACISPLSARPGRSQPDVRASAACTATCHVHVQHHLLSKGRVRAMQVLAVLVRYALQPDIAVATHGITLLRACVTEQAPLLTAPLWSTTLKALSMAASSDALTVSAGLAVSAGPIPLRCAACPCAVHVVHVNTYLLHAACCSLQAAGLF